MYHRRHLEMEESGVEVRASLHITHGSLQSPQKEREPRVGGRIEGPTPGCPSVNRQDALYSLFCPSGE